MDEYSEITELKSLNNNPKKKKKVKKKKNW